MTNHELESTLAYAHGVAAFATRQWQPRAFVARAKELYASAHERQAYVTGYLTAAMNQKESA